MSSTNHGAPVIRIIDPSINEAESTTNFRCDVLYHGSLIISNNKERIKIFLRTVIFADLQVVVNGTKQDEVLNIIIDYWIPGTFIIKS